MASAAEEEARITVLAAEVTSARKADVYHFAGGIQRNFAAKFRYSVLENRCRKNALLLLTTFGGDGDAAYQMARGLQDGYPDGKVAVLVSSYCKSAGTLVALGAHEIIMTDLAELGPLDVQITKPDTLGEHLSGLTPGQSLSTLRAEAFQCFEKFFLDILERSNSAITARTAAMIAANVTAGLYRPIYAQIDPMKLGEFQRAVQIASEYGRRLDEGTRNLKDKALSRLITGYPSHEFVIDRKEAQTLFHRVTPPSEKEDELAGLLAPNAIRTAGGSNVSIRYLSPSDPERPADGGGDSTAAPGAGKQPARTGGSPSRNGRERRGNPERQPGEVAKGAS